MIQNNETAPLVPILWKSHVYNLAFTMNVRCVIQSSKTALMVPVLWEVHAYNPALTEHEMGQTNAATQDSYGLYTR